LGQPVNRYVRRKASPVRADDVVLRVIHLAAPYQRPLPVYVPPADTGSGSGSGRDTDEAQQQVDTIASRFKKDWPLIGLGLLGIFLAVRSGIFQR